MTNLVDLPDVVLEHIFYFLAFDEVAQNRLVCKRFNVVGGRVLNKGFYAVEKFNSKTVREIKAKLPRRESERRNHPLERQCSVLISVETRINMLAMTYSKWINNLCCCFIPGKVIDEIYRVVRSVIKNTETPSDNENVRAIEILQELRDISSMAMEHFDDKILPQLKRNYYKSSVEYMVDNASGEEIGFVDVLDGLVKHSSILVPTAARYGLPKVTFPPQDYITTQQLTGAAPLTPPNYLRLLIRESVNRVRLQAQAVQISTQSKDIADLRKQVDEWEEKFKELSAIVLKQAVPNTKDKISTSTNNTSESLQASDDSKPSTSKQNDEDPGASLDEDERSKLKRKNEECEEEKNKEYKIPKIAESQKLLDD